MGQKGKVYRLMPGQVKEELLSEGACRGEIKTVRYHNRGNRDLSTWEIPRAMPNVKESYSFWLARANVILRAYGRQRWKYQMFTEISLELIKRGREIEFPKNSVFRDIVNLLHLSRLVMHNRVRRNTPKDDLLYANTIAEKDLAFTLTTEEYVPTEQKKQVVQEEEFFGRIVKILDKYRSKEGLREFTEARQILMVYAVNGTHKSVSVLSDVGQLLYRYEKALEDGVVRDFLENEEGGMQA